MKKKLSNEELITFCGQMALILKSGISSLEGIYIMEDGDVQTEGGEILKEIREELEMCGMLYPAMKKTGVFPEYALHMTEIGEQTGRLDETMEALAAYYQREEEILDEVKSAVTYPVAMLGMLLVIVAVLFIKVMPVFEQVYMQLGQEMTGVALSLVYLICSFFAKSLCEIISYHQEKNNYKKDLFRNRKRPFCVYKFFRPFNIVKSINNTGMISASN